MYNRRTHNYVQFITLIYSWRNRVQREWHGKAEWVCLNGYSHTSLLPRVQERRDTGGEVQVLALPRATYDLEQGIWLSWVSGSFSRKQESMLSKIPAPLQQFSHLHFLLTLNHGQSCQHAWGGEEDLGSLLGTTIVFNIFVLLQPPMGGQTSEKINKTLPFYLRLI